MYRKITIISVTVLVFTTGLFTPNDNGETSVSAKLAVPMASITPIPDPIASPTASPTSMPSPAPTDRPTPSYPTSTPTSSPTQQLTPTPSPTM